MGFFDWHKEKGTEHTDYLKKLKEERKEAKESGDEEGQARKEQEIRARESGGRHLGGAVHHITKRKNWIYAAIISVIVSSVGFFFLGVFAILIGIAIFFLYLMFKKWPRFTIGLIILIFVIYFIWMFVYGGGGYFSTEVSSFGTEVKQSLKPVTAQLSITRMMLSGEYDPSEIWTSKVYKDRYAKEVGVEVSDVRPLRDYFSTSDKAIIIGTLKVTALSESPDGISQGITVKVSAEDGGDWDCDPDSDKDTLVLSRTERFFGRFQCISKSPLVITDPNLDQESKEVEVKVKLNEFETIAGKSTYVVDYNTLNLLYLEDEDPMKYFELKKDQISSWQSSSPINLGIGILGEKDIIAANDDKNRVVYYLAVTINNRGTGNLLDINKLIIEIPEKIKFKEGTDNDFERKKTEGIHDCESLGSLKVCKYKLKGGKKNLCGFGEFTNCKLEPGEYKTFYLKFKAPRDSFLEDASIKEFFALADISFDYEDITLVAVQVRKL